MRKERFSSVEEEEHPLTGALHVAQLVPGQAGEALRSLAADHPRPLGTWAETMRFPFAQARSCRDAISTSGSSGTVQ